MKAILEFNLPEEEHEHSLAIKSTDLHCVIHALDQELRSVIKYSSGLDQSALDAYQAIRTKLWELINEYGVEDLL